MAKPSRDQRQVKAASSFNDYLVPDELRGRVMSLYMLDRGLMPAGALFAGVVAHLIGAPLAVTSMGTIVVVLTLLVAWRVPHIRTLES